MQKVKTVHKGFVDNLALLLVTAALPGLWLGAELVLGEEEGRDAALGGGGGGGGPQRGGRGGGGGEAARAQGEVAGQPRGERGEGAQPSTLPHTWGHCYS